MKFLILPLLLYTCIASAQFDSLNFDISIVSSDSLISSQSYRIHTDTIKGIAEVVFDWDAGDVGWIACYMVRHTSRSILLEPPKYFFEIPESVQSHQAIGGQLYEFQGPVTITLPPEYVLRFVALPGSKIDMSVDD